MARNYENEMKWQKEKLVRFDTKIDREKYGAVLTEIKEKIGPSAFLKKAIELYQASPNLFLEDK